MNPIYDLLRADGSIVINKNLITGIGLNESIMFCELLSRHYYFAGQKQLQEDGSFFNTIFDLSLATGLADKAQRTAITSLKNLGLLNVSVKGIPAKRYFKVCGSQELIQSYLKQGADKREELIEKHRKNPLNITVLPKAETCHPQERLLALADGGRNNTTYNTNPIIPRYNHNGSASEDDTTSMVKDCMVKARTSISYYFDTYRRYMGASHPKLKKNQVERISISLDEYDEGQLEAMTDRHFKRSHLETDYNINHFATEGILQNLFFEAGLQ